MEERYITTVDLGSSKIALTVAKVSGEQVEVVYYRETPSEGIRKSFVLNPMKAAASLKKAVATAESELGIKILQVVVGLPGHGVQQVSASGTISRTNPDSCIEQSEIDLLKSNALAGSPKTDDPDEEVYGAVAQSFNADDMVGIPEEDVIGMTGEKLEGNFKLFIGSKKRSLTNIDKMLALAEIAPARKCFLPATTGNAVLTSSEKENGVALIEIGGDLTTLTIFHGGLLRHYSSIPFGGRSVTFDIKYQYGLRESLAENIKFAFGGCLPGKLQSLGEKIIQINDEDGSCLQIPVADLSEVIDARMREIFEAVLYNIEESGYADRLRNGLVLTGGGANLTNCALLLKEMSGYNVRTGYPRCKHISTMGCPSVNETSACASIGMLMDACKDNRLNCSRIQEKAPEKPVEEQPEVKEGDISTMWTVEKPAKKHFSFRSPKKSGEPKEDIFKKAESAFAGALEGTLGSLFDDMK